jgi:Asparagine synthase
MLTRLELAAGFPLPLPGPPLRLPRSDLEPRSALQSSVLAGLSRPPCVVSFSGGRDSSLVLAVAVDVARREGLPLPVPVTVRVAGDPESEEGDWQERVIRHLRLDDWVRVDVGGELDCIGPIAQEILLRHGILWPANVHFHVPQLERAAGGSVLTGVGGDEILSSSGWARLRRVLAGKEIPEPRDALRLAAALAPRTVQRRAVLARTEVDLDWLRPDAQRRVLVALAHQTAAEPLGWRRRFDWLLGLRYLELGRRSLNVLAGDWNVEMHHPFLEPMFVGTLASLPRSRRFDGRTKAFTTLFGNLLPTGLASRSSKAVFAGTLWGDASREFVSRWDGSGVDSELVDVEALRRRWQVDGTPGPHTLLQSLWLERERARQAASSTSSSNSSTSDIAAQDLGRRSSQAGSALS